MKKLVYMITMNDGEELKIYVAQPLKALAEMIAQTKFVVVGEKLAISTSQIKKIEKV